MPIHINSLGVHAMNKKILTIASAVALGAFAVTGSVYAAAGANEVGVAKEFAHSVIDVSTGIDVTTTDLAAGSKQVTIGTFCVSTNATNPAGERFFRVTAANTLAGVTDFTAKGYAGTDTDGATIGYSVAVNDSGTLTESTATEVKANSGNSSTNCTGSEENIIVTLNNLDPASTRAGLYQISFSVAAAESEEHGNESRGT